MIKNLPANAGDTGSIPGLGTKIPDAKGQPSWSVTTTETALWSPGAKTTEAHTRQSWCSATGEAHTPQLESSPHLLQREEAQAQQRRPTAATKKFY